MGDCMYFPRDWRKFLNDYSFNDHKEFYTNGARLISTFRVEQMMEHYLQKVATEINDGHKWIPVTERLPDKDGTYMCFNRGAYGKWAQAVRFTKDARKFDEYAFKNQWKNQWLMYDSEYGYYAVGSITHWMPLPEPPKED